MISSFPETITAHIADKPYTVDDIGRSGSVIYLFDDCVLKVEPHSEETERIVSMMRWLAGKVPSPEVIAFETDGEKDYLLMSRLEGEMACSPYWLSHHEEMIGLLADALKMLWSVEITGCPVLRDPDALLATAEKRFINGEADPLDAAPELFDESGFSDPQAMLDWLKENKPPFEPVFSHGDFCLPNILIKDKKVSGFIDLNYAGVSDKWTDIFMCLQSLRWNFDGTFGGPVYPDGKPELLFEKLGMKPDHEKLYWNKCLDAFF